MAQSVLMVYEKISSIADSEYWTKYINFYQKYWDGPATPQSSWWGQEYENFRESLSDHLGIDKSHIKDCFFIKDKQEEYFICPIGSQINLNILAIDNIIPFEWFLLFNENEKNYFYTHTGFGAVHHDSIYYTTTLENSVDRINKAEEILKNISEKEPEILKNYDYLKKIHNISQGIFNIKDWLSGFGTEGRIILNYGEISNHIVQDSMKNENSVGELWDIIDKLAARNFEEADLNLKYLDIKWSDISRNAAGIVPETSTSLQ